jgi:hypothetical protein
MRAGGRPSRTVRSPSHRASAIANPIAEKGLIPDGLGYAGAVCAPTRAQHEQYGETPWDTLESTRVIHRLGPDAAKQCQR